MSNRLQEVDESQDNEILDLPPKELLDLLSTFNNQRDEFHTEQVKAQERRMFIKQYLKTVLIQKLIKLNVITKNQATQFKSLPLKNVIEKIKTQAITQHNKPATPLRRKENAQYNAITPKVKENVETIKLHLKKDLKAEDSNEDINSLLKDLADEQKNGHHKETDIDRLLLNKDKDKDKDKDKTLEVLKKIEEEMIYEEEDKIILLRQIAESLGLKGEEAKEFIDNGIVLSLEVVSDIKNTLEACGLGSVIPQIQNTEDMQHTFQGRLSQAELDKHQNKEGIVI
ncbi:MAG: hypothetical protein ACI9CD_000536 [Candidatus Deianiraeaceae bacterium]|jgi:hypothetical protein